MEINSADFTKTDIAEKEGVAPQSITNRMK